MRSNNGRKLDFVDALSYPSKKLRLLGKEPISVPRDPLIISYTPFKGKKVNPNNFYYALFFTAFDVRDYTKDIRKFMKIFSPLNIKKVYLETYRDGYAVDKDVLIDAKRKLEKEGFKVSGAVTTTHFSDKVKYNEGTAASGCYTDKEANRKMKKVLELSASIFNEIIIDDWYFTICRCPQCTKAKGKKTWQEFRSRLMHDVAKKYIIEPSKKVNKNVNLILKLPQWYEKYYYSGYDLNKLIPVFDEIAVGTETRDFRKARFMPVHGTMLFKYIKNMAPDKVKKAWFDIYLCDREIYVEQAYQSVLGGADEVILFCAGIMPQKNMRPLVENLIINTGKIDRLSSFSNIFNIPLIRETNALSDDKLNQYFLMSGIPIYITDRKSVKEDIVILTEDSTKKQGNVKLFNSLIKAKKNIFMTVNFAKEIKKYFDVKRLKRAVKVNNVRYNGKEDNVVKDNIFIETEVNNGRNLALLNNAYSFMSYFKIKESKVWVVNLPYTKDEIITHMDTKQNAHYRFLVRSAAMTEALKDVFKNYTSVNLYNKIKTFYKYNI